MFVMKVKWENIKEPVYYGNFNKSGKESIVENIKYIQPYDYLSAKKRYNEFLKDWLTYSKSEAKGMMPDYVAVVELSNYPPHSEYEVRDFHEFK